MKRLPAAKPAMKLWVQAAIASLWLAVGTLWIVSGTAQIFEGWLDRPFAFQTRELLGKTSELTPRLKVFAFDDRTFATVGKPYMTGDTWATVVDNISASKPHTIVFNYMFGAGEFSGPENGLLGEKLDRATGLGIRIVGASIPYPGQAKFRDPLPLDHPEFSLPSAFAEVGAPYKDHRGYSLYGPPGDSAILFQGFGHTIYNPRGTIPAALILAPDRAVAHLSLTTIGTLGFTKDNIFVGNNPLPVDRNGNLSIDFVTPRQYGTQIKSLGALLTGPSDWIQPGDIVLILTNFYTGGSSFASTPFGTMPTGWITMAAVDTAVRDSWAVTWGSTAPWLFLALCSGWIIGWIRSPTLFWGTLVGTTAAFLLGCIVVFAYTHQLFVWSATAPTFLGMAVHMWIRQMQLQLRASQVDRLQHERETARLNAVVRTAQMFAHDVRKPFRLVQMARETFKMTSDPRKIREKVETLLPELESAVATVESMVRDLMDFDGQLRLQRRNRYLEDLIVRSLEQVCRGRPQLRLKFSYRFDHRLPVHVDESKLMRVITNLVENAIDASGQNGHIWFHLEDIQDGERTQVLLVIGNEGSVIPPEKLQQIFEAFYTSGKRDGTGLGLAIAKQIITAHGGKIWCQSDSLTGTEFYMTLPIAHATPYTPVDADLLPATSTGFLTQIPIHQTAKRSVSGHAQRSVLVVVDDSQFTLETWQAIVTDADVKSFLSPRLFWQAVEEDPEFLSQINILVTDYYFDQDGDNGFAFAKALRALSDVPIFLSTDGVVEKLPAAINGRIGKEPVPYALLQSRLPEAG